tara:strand:- start:56 stop:550 length:495 start_codon:yes stop_codon:yes gene_type:complete
MINKGLFTSNKPNWQTPKWLFDKLNNHFNFLCDVCAEDHNTLCDKYYTSYDSCLDKDWEVCNFMNPPYGREIGKFIEKAYTEWVLNDFTTVALLPARTDTKWFHNFIYNQARIVFIKGRLKFEGGKKLAPAPFPSMIVVWWGVEKINDKDFLSNEQLEKLINKE